MAHIGKLSTLKVAALIKAGKTGRYGDGGNLYLQVTGTSSSWIFRYKVGRRLRDAGNGHTVRLHVVEHLHTRARGDAKRVGGVTFDHNLVVAGGIG